MDRSEFHRLAEYELNEAAQYYDLEEPGLGAAFLEDELRQNLHEVAEMLLEDGEPKPEAEFVGVQVIQVA
jgi:hypothetical protein